MHIGLHPLGCVYYLCHVPRAWGTEPNTLGHTMHPQHGIRARLGLGKLYSKTILLCYAPMLLIGFIMLPRIVYYASIMPA